MDCPYCKSTSTKQIFSSTYNADGLFLNKTKVGLFSCQNCHFYFTEPPICSALNSFDQYETGVYKSSNARLSIVVDKIHYVFIDYKINKILKISGTNKSNLLDIGCGKGRFLSRILKKGWKCTGLEPSKGQAEFAIKRYGLEVVIGTVDDINLQDKVFDVITSWHVLEHLSDPNDFMVCINKLLKQNGLLVIEVPNILSWQAKLGKNHWFHLDMPRHLFHYSKNSINLLLEMAGFNILKIETFCFEVGPFGLLQSILNILQFPPNLLYRWLKRCQINESKVVLFMNLFVAIILVIPCVITEVISSYIFQSGGVLRVYATKK